MPERFQDPPADPPPDLSPGGTGSLDTQQGAALLRLMQPDLLEPRSGEKWRAMSVEDLQAALPEYQILGIIGRGGMGAVYLAKQANLRRTVAIKVLPPESSSVEDEFRFIERFKREGHTMARLSHPSIVDVYESGQTEAGLLYLVMEFIEGTDVFKMIKQQGRLPQKEALRIMQQVCDALSCAHEHGIIHRDVKPSNVMVDTQGRVKVADFGLAKVINSESVALTHSDVIVGSPDFMAPESTILGAQVDHRADLYAAGVMLYQMLTGSIPRGTFKLPNQMVPELDARLNFIMRKALKVDPDERYQSSTEFRAELDEIVTSLLAKEEEKKAGPSRVRPWRKREASRPSPPSIPTPPATPPKVMQEVAQAERPKREPPKELMQEGSSAPSNKRKPLLSWGWVVAPPLAMLATAAWVLIDGGTQEETGSLVPTQPSASRTVEGPPAKVATPVFTTETKAEVAAVSVPPPAPKTTPVPVAPQPHASAPTPAPILPPAPTGAVITRVTKASPTLWTDTQGRILQANFVRIEGTHVVLDISGRVQPVALTTLSDASQKIARDLQTALPSSAHPVSIKLMKLSDWKRHGVNSWSERNGAFLSSASQTGHLYREFDFDDFEIEGEFMADAKGNGGIGFAVKTMQTNQHFPDTGYQFQLLGSGLKDQKKTGSLITFPEGALVMIQDNRVADGTWATFRIRFEGTHLQGWLNGKEVFNTVIPPNSTRARGRILSLEQMGAGGLVGYRNLTIVRIGNLTSASATTANSQPTTNPTSAPAASGPADSINFVATATKEKPFVNGLGMKFVPVPGTKVLMCIHETRRMDYEEYAENTPGLDASWRNQSWRGQVVGNGAQHPVTGMSHREARGFCEWLAKRDGRGYRLPTDREWSFAIGIASQEAAGKTPAELKNGIQNTWSWGNEFPPRRPVANLADESLKVVISDVRIIPGYRDGFPTTAPVMSFPPNSLGIHDLGGNVSEWVEDAFGGEFPTHATARMGDWRQSSKTWSMASHRTPRDAEKFRAVDFGFRVVIELPAK